MGKSNSAAQLRESELNRQQQERFFQETQAASREQFNASAEFQKQQSADMRNMSRVTAQGTPTATDSARAGADMAKMLLQKKGFDKYRFTA